MRTRIISTLVLLLGFSIQATAQFHSITGSVVDQNNNPIEGARVRVLYTTKHDTTDQEGHFKIAIKKRPKKIRVHGPKGAVALLKAERNMFIHLTDKPYVGWQPNAWHFFAGIDFGFFCSASGTNSVYASQRSGVTTRSLGVVCGITDSRMGIYMKSNVLAFNDKDDDDEIASKRNVRDVIAGGIIHVWKPVYMNVGLGAMFFTERTSNYNSFTSVTSFTDEKKTKPIVDIGLTGRYSHYQLSSGILTVFHRHEWHPYIGVSYLF